MTAAALPQASAGFGRGVRLVAAACAVVAGRLRAGAVGPRRASGRCSSPPTRPRRPRRRRRPRRGWRSARSPGCYDDPADPGRVLVAAGAAARVGAALAERPRLVGESRGVAAGGHRGADRGIRLVTGDDPEGAVGELPSGAVAAVADGRAALAGRRAVDRVAAEVHGDADRDVALVSGADAEDAGRFLPGTGDPAVLDEGAALAVGHRVTGERDGVAAHVDRGGDRRVDLVA